MTVHVEFFWWFVEVRLVLRVWFLSSNTVLMGLLQLHLLSRAVWMERAGQVTEAKALMFLF